jgi:DMSO/TMAO reductase YedYZ heme-binding membrane subunit
MVSAVLLVASLVWGVLLTTRALKPIDRPVWLLAMHRWLSAMACVGIGLHVLTLVADNYVHFGWKEILVPMGSDWRPGAVTWGVVAFYMVIAIQITSWLMRKMPRRIWHMVHLLAYPLFVVGTVHGFQSGADRSNKLVQWIALLVIELVFGLTLFRALTYTPRKRKAEASSATPSPAR